MSYQRYIMVGHLTDDPEMKYVGETPKTTFSVAVNEKYGEKEYAFFANVEAWDKLGENVANYMRKGSKVLVEGRWRTDKWTDDDGGKHKRDFVRADAVKFLDRKEDREEREPPARKKAADYDDLPF